MSHWTRFLLGAASALTLASVPLASANADGINGTVEGDYAHIDLTGGNGSANQWGANGSAEIGLGLGGFDAQVDGGYDSTSDHQTIGEWHYGGDLFWTGERGRLGVTAEYHWYSCCHVTVDGWNYGGFAELFLMPELTVGLKGGGFNASSNEINSVSVNLKGAYLGAEAVGYVMPDLALSGMFDYTSFDHGVSEDDYTAQGEWLVSEETPVSVTLGYTRSEFGQTNVSANTFQIGIKLYLDSNGAQTLVDRQRSATEGWGSKFTSSAVALQF